MVPYFRRVVLLLLLFVCAFQLSVMPDASAGRAPAAGPIVSAPAPPDDLLINMWYAHCLTDLFYYDILTDSSDSHDLAQNIRNYLKWAADGGMTWLLMDFMWIGDNPGTAIVNTDSPTLRAMGYTLENNTPVLEPFAVAAHDLGQKVVVNIEGLAHVLYNYKDHDGNLDQPGRKLDKQKLESIIRELKQAGADGIYEEAFADDMMQVIRDTTRSLGMAYYHCFDDSPARPDVLVSEDYALYPVSDSQYRHICDEMGTTVWYSVGAGSILFGHARARGIPAIVGTAGNWGMRSGMQYNISVFRMVDFDPAGFGYWAAGDADHKWIKQQHNTVGLPATVRKLYKEFGLTANARPKANLVIDRPDAATGMKVNEVQAYFAGAADFMTNTLSAAGYELHVTYDNPLPDADAYMVFAMGNHWNGMDNLTAETAHLFASDKPVVLVTVCGLPGPDPSGRWQTVRKALGITTTAAFTVDFKSGNIPQTLVFQGKAYRFKGYDIYEAGHKLEQIPVSAVDAEVIAARDIAFVIRKGNKCYVNTNNIHIELSSLIANVLAPDPQNQTFNRPSSAYVVRGPLTAVLATENTEVDINLPLAAGTPASVVVFDSSGVETYRNDAYPIKKPFTYRLDEWSLLTVKPAAKAPPLMPGGVKLLRIDP